MHPDDLLERLVELDVLTESRDAETVSVSGAFRAAVDEADAALAEGYVDDVLEERFDDPEVVAALAAIAADDSSFVAHFCALAERADALSHEDLIRTVAVLTQFRGTQPRTEGVPDPFLPVRGDQLSTLLGLSARAVVYVWMEDCEPCDLVRETFEELFEQPPDDVALFAVYGPEWAELLYEEFDVSGAPTTLFVRDGAVDSRLHGAHYSKSYEGEIETLRELTRSDSSPQESDRRE